MNLEAASTIQNGDDPAPPAGTRLGNAQLACDPACLERTCQSLQQFELATEEEVRQLYSHGSAALAGPRPWDPLEFVAALRVSEPDARPVEVERLGRGLAAAAGQALTLIPFAARIPTPSSFYDDHADLRLQCHQLLVPILYAEEMEVVGIASINPVALDLAEQFVVADIHSRTGNNPLISKLLLHHDSWMSLCQKQFAL
ncbi:MAG: hypothetical protein HKN82_06730 [Akkermansiaceae bacterium]|nr:hypothetical protein [Akkermansiaceae bacterium]NNM28409.1 hypothetical protein [Akkermansiaceae bacterium]